MWFSVASPSPSTYEILRAQKCLKKKWDVLLVPITWRTFQALCMASLNMFKLLYKKNISWFLRGSGWATLTDIFMELNSVLVKSCLYVCKASNITVVSGNSCKLSQLQNLTSFCLSPIKARMFRRHCMCVFAKYRTLC